MKYNNKIILAIETSCDDTSVAILKNEKVLSCVTKTGYKKSNIYGGIIPEIAARFHEKNLISATIEAIQKSKINLHLITDIAYTKNPGLVGCLFVGEIYAKSLSNMLNIPCHQINHIHGHILSPFINRTPKYPFISLIASGKTTSIFLVESPNQITELINTVDDAIGEAFDKIGKALKYNYPGGPYIDKNFDLSMATINFLPSKKNEVFSFSGIKNKVLTYIKHNWKYDDEKMRITIGSSFMKCAIDLLIDKLEHYAKKYNCKTICIGGGVASNSYFREKIEILFEDSFVPKKEYSTDNAAMIGFLCFQKLIWNIN